MSGTGWWPVATMSGAGSWPGSGSRLTRRRLPAVPRREWSRPPRARSASQVLRTVCRVRRSAVPVVTPDPIAPVTVLRQRRRPRAGRGPAMCPDSRSESSNRCPATRSPVRRLIVELPLKAYGMHRSASTLLLSGIMVASCATTSSPSPGSSAAAPSEEPPAAAPPTPAGPRAGEGRVGGEGGVGLVRSTGKLGGLVGAHVVTFARIVGGDTERGTYRDRHAHRCGVALTDRLGQPHQLGRPLWPGERHAGRACPPRRLRGVRPGTAYEVRKWAIRRDHPDRIRVRGGRGP